MVVQQHKSRPPQVIVHHHSSSQPNVVVHHSSGQQKVPSTFFDLSVARIHSHPLMTGARIGGGVGPLRPLLDPVQHLIPTTSAAAAGKATNLKPHFFQYSKCTGKRKALCVRPFDSVSYVVHTL